MPGVAEQSATLFWFEIDVHSGSFPFGTQLASDAAAFFKATLGFTSNGYNGGSYVHAYLNTTDLGPSFGVHGFAPWPGTVPTVTFAPALSWVWVRPFFAGTPCWRNCGFSLPIPKALAVSGDPVPVVQTALDAVNPTWAAGWTSQGRRFVPVSVSYLHRDWIRVEELRATGFPAGRIHRQTLRRNRLVGNEPKLLP